MTTVPAPGAGGPSWIPALPPSPPSVMARRRRSALTWVTMAVLGVGALAIAVLIFLFGGPTATVLSTVLAAVSYPLLIAVCFWLDRYEPEPARYRLAALGWGGVVAVFLSMIAEQIFFAVPGTDDFVDTAITAPLVEEAAKGLFLVAVVIFRRSQMHGLLDGIVYGALVGIGFAFVEDILYYLSSLGSGGVEALGLTFFLRGVMGPFAHPLFTLATGIGVGIAVASARPAVRVLAPILGFTGAVALHGLWNGSTFWGGEGFFRTYFFIMVPVLLVALALAFWARWREGAMLRTTLGQLVPLGWLRADEVRWLARMSDRMSARGYAKIHGGKPAARAMRAYQQVFTEIAFLHQRVVSGTAPRDADARLQALLASAAAVRPYVLMPAPVAAPQLPPNPYAPR